MEAIFIESPEFTEKVNTYNGLLEKYDELTAGVLTPTEAARLKHLIMQSNDLPGAVAFSAIARSGL